MVFFLPSFALHPVLLTSHAFLLLSILPNIQATKHGIHKPLRTHVITLQVQARQNRKRRFYRRRQIHLIDPPVLILVTQIKPIP
jgi:hypothetical protein